jgi:CRP/FNR family cyclic AMP-dependent transcriptional regulator
MTDTLPLAADRAFRARPLPLPAQRRGMVHVLAADPDLALALAPQERRAAAQVGLAPAFTHGTGRWMFTPPPDAAALGTLVLDGLIGLRISAGERAHLELLGPGDVISPWTGSGPELTYASGLSAFVISDLRLALLDRAFALRTARWPEIHAAVTQRLIARSRRLSLQAAINSVPRVEERVELTLWELAYRFGKVTPAGLKLPLRLTHTQLAEIVAAQRPSVTTALVRLERLGRVARDRRNGWILCGEEPSHLNRLARQSALLA